jgi:hypothetical protein
LQIYFKESVDEKMLVLLACLSIPLGAMAEKWDEVKRMDKFTIYVDSSSIERPSPGGPFFLKSVYVWDKGTTGKEKEAQKILVAGHDCKSGTMYVQYTKRFDESNFPMGDYRTFSQTFTPSAGSPEEVLQNYVYKKFSK